MVSDPLTRPSLPEDRFSQAAGLPRLIMFQRVLRRAPNVTAIRFIQAFTGLIAGGASERGSRADDGANALFAALAWGFTSRERENQQGGGEFEAPYGQKPRRAENWTFIFTAMSHPIRTLRRGF